MSRLVWLLAVFSLLASTALAQTQAEQDTQEDSQTEVQQQPDKAPAHSSARDRETAESSSKNTKIDLSPPKNDAKDHPYSGAAVVDAAEDSGDVKEFGLWDPHKAAKDMEVADFYFKRKNYPAALDRYREALMWKPNDALANLGMAKSLELLGRPDEARPHYEEYLKILPNGKFSEEARKGLERLDQARGKEQASGTQKSQ